jgi:hypothetical protein
VIVWLNDQLRVTLLRHHVLASICRRATKQQHHLADNTISTSSLSSTSPIPSFRDKRYLQALLPKGTGDIKFLYVFVDVAR